MNILRTTGTSWVFDYVPKIALSAGIVDLNPERRWLVSAQLASLSHRFAQKTAHFRRVLLGKSRQL